MSSVHVKLCFLTSNVSAANTMKEWYDSTAVHRQIQTIPPATANHHKATITDVGENKMVSSDTIFVQIAAAHAFAQECMAMLCSESMAQGASQRNVNVEEDI